MSIVILSANIGDEHISVMNTLEDEFKRQNYYDIYTYPSYEEYHYNSRLLSGYYNYLITLSQIELCSKLYELFVIERFDLLEEYYQESRQKTLELVTEDGLEAIVSTSPLINNNIVRSLQETGLIKNIPFYIVITDPFDPIAPGFDTNGATKYFCATEVVRRILVNAGIENQKIQVIDYPVSARFNKKYSDIEKELIYKKLSLFPNMHTILLNSGALGSAHYLELLKIMLDNDGEDYQIIMICGMNKKMYEIAHNLKENKRRKHIKILSYVDNIEDILQISDIVVTKPGANAFYECLYSETPMIVDSINGLLYQEKGVIDYLIDYGVGVILKNIKDLPDLLKYIFNNGLIRKIKNNIRKLSLQNGTPAIINTVLNDI